MKRNFQSDGSASKSRKSYNEFRGYTVKKADTIASVSDIEVFRSQFVDARKPAKLTCSAPIDIAKFRLASIVRTLHYEAPLQVERKVKFGFGSGKEREHLTLEEIAQKLKSADDSYYLTTQYDDNENASENDEHDREDDRGGDFDFGDGNLEGQNEDKHHEETESDEEQLQALSTNFIPEASSDDDSIDFSNLQDDFVDENRSDSEADGEMDPDDIQFRVKSLFQPPLTNLSQNPEFPITPKPFENLITQQINLWMGSSAEKEDISPDLTNPSVESLGRYLPKGNSSGLHHDHADNLYVLVQGRKRFTLYSPNDAEMLYTVGDINKIYGNGLIDYQVNANARLWRPMREDGAIKGEWAKWALEKDIKCDFSETQLEDLIENEPHYEGEFDASIDPPSFSRIPPILAHLDEVSNSAERKKLEAFADAKFPGFRGLRKLEVWLEPGEMLYIPTGWFHEVSSFGSSNEDNYSVHIALNWWFVPPSKSISNPYEDAYWRDDLEITQKAINLNRSNLQNEFH